MFSGAFHYYTFKGEVAVYRRLIYRQTRHTAAILAWHEILLTVPGPVDIAPPVESQAKNHRYQPIAMTGNSMKA